MDIVSPPKIISPEGRLLIRLPNAVGPTAEGTRPRCREHA